MSGEAALDEVRTCARCEGTAGAPPGGLPVGWSLATERGGVAFHCAACTRANLRSIESRLDEEWWER